MERDRSVSTGDTGWQRHDPGPDGQCSHGSCDRGAQACTPGRTALDGASERSGDTHHCSEDAVPPHACLAAAELMMFPVPRQAKPLCLWSIQPVRKTALDTTSRSSYN